MLHEAKTLLEIEKVIPDDKEVAENFKGFLSIQFPVRILPKENYEVDVGTDNNLILNHIIDLQIV